MARSTAARSWFWRTGADDFGVHADFAFVWRQSDLAAKMGPWPHSLQSGLRNWFKCIESCRPWQPSMPNRVWSKLRTETDSIDMSKLWNSTNYPQVIWNWFCMQLGWFYFKQASPNESHPSNAGWDFHRKQGEDHTYYCDDDYHEFGFGCSLSSWARRLKTPNHSSAVSQVDGVTSWRMDQIYKYK